MAMSFSMSLSLVLMVLSVFSILTLLPMLNTLKVLQVRALYQPTEALGFRWRKVLIGTGLWLWTVVFVVCTLNVVLLVTGH